MTRPPTHGAITGAITPLHRAVAVGALAVAGLFTLGGCGSDSPDAPPATTAPQPGSGDVTASTAPPASVAGQDSANTLGSPGSFGEKTTSGG